MTELLDFFDKEKLASLTINIPAGEILFQQGEAGQSMYFVKKGRLEAFISDSQGKLRRVGEIEEGEPVGEMQVLTGGKRTATVKALVDSELVALPLEQFDRLRTESPALYERLEHLILQRLRRNHLLLLLPDLFGLLDEEEFKALETELEWRQVKKGERLIRQGDAGEAMYIVLSGRLHVLVEDARGEEKMVLEIGRGETVGEMALFNDAPRTASVDAVRDSLLLRISKSAFFSSMARFPKLHEHVTRVMIRRLQKAAHPSRPEARIATIAVVPIAPSVPISDFVRSLNKALSSFGSTLHVSRERLSQLADFRPQVEWFDDRSDSLRLAVWLDSIERHHRFVLFEADPHPSTWNDRLMQYADRILLLGDAHASPALTPVEKTASIHTTANQQILVLRHPSDASFPTGTANWLAPRRVNHHFHQREGNSEDTDRLARFLAGRSVGLVLGGGGARGFAHIGVVRAFREAGIPIDMVGGTSMGAVVAAHAGMELDYREILIRNRQAFVEARPFRKQWFPFYSFYKGRKLDEVTHQILYQDVDIEDLWRPCFIVSCSLGTSELVVHEQGKIWRAIRASTALPGVVTPVSDGRRLHVDGGLMNNLPVDLMRERCPGPIAAVEVSDMMDLDATNLTPPSLFAYFKDRWMRLAPENAFPGVLEILMRSMLLGSQQNVKRARRQAELVLHPPVEKFGLLEFDAIDKIAEAGYQYAKEALTQWSASQANL